MKNYQKMKELILSVLEDRLDFATAKTHNIELDYMDSIEQELTFSRSYIRLCAYKRKRNCNNG